MELDLIATGLSCEVIMALNIPIVMRHIIREAIITPNILASRYLKKLFIV
jgi:hypothetical protein